MGVMTPLHECYGAYSNGSGSLTRTELNRLGCVSDESKLGQVQIYIWRTSAVDTRATGPACPITQCPNSIQKL